MTPKMNSHHALTWSQLVPFAFVNLDTVGYASTAPTGVFCPCPISHLEWGEQHRVQMNIAGMCSLAVLWHRFWNHSHTTQTKLKWNTNSEHEHVTLEVSLVNIFFCDTVSQTRLELKKKHIEIGAKHVTNNNAVKENHIQVGTQLAPNMWQMNYIITITLKQNPAINCRVGRNTRVTHISVDRGLGVNRCSAHRQFCLPGHSMTNVIQKNRQRKMPGKMMWSHSLVCSDIVLATVEWLCNDPEGQQLERATKLLWCGRVDVETELVGSCTVFVHNPYDWKIVSLCLKHFYGCFFVVFSAIVNACWSNIIVRTNLDWGSAGDAQFGCKLLWFIFGW